ncbi:MAG TPA: HepT-like ribonuclease domain-containing protein [Polyangiaceae bacterium]|nr:HepT-like ribonuclease domain-containing protein [Polyangiaceae bacterium]
MRTNHERVRDAIEAIDRCFSQAERGREVFETDPLVQVWMVHHLEILGEACRAVTAELRAAHPEVPWAAIVGMRNVLAHDYFGIDLTEVWSTVERDLPPLRAQLAAAFADIPEPPPE